MAQIFLIHGFLGVGKTTIAEQLSQEQAAIRFTHDEFMSILYGKDPPIELFAEYKTRVDQVIDLMWKRCAAAGAKVVLDLNFWTRLERNDVRRFLTQQNIPFKLIQVQCPENIAIARVLKRNENPENRLYISEATFKTLASRFEALGDDEPHETITTA